MLVVQKQTRSEEHTSELQSHSDLVCRLLLEKKNNGRRHRRPQGFSVRHHLCLLSLLCRGYLRFSSRLFFFNDTATTEIYTLSLHDALPISLSRRPEQRVPMSRLRQ